MAESIPKIKIMKGAAPDLSAATYQIHDETHTIGNALRWMLMKNPKVEFCGYSTMYHIREQRDSLTTVNGYVYSHVRVLPHAAMVIQRHAPHPSENIIQVRIQMHDNLSSLSALITAMDNLDDLCQTVEEKYVASLKEDKYERWVEKS